MQIVMDADLTSVGSEEASQEGPAYVSFASEDGEQEFILEGDPTSIIDICVAALNAAKKLGGR